jgi:hypothetical protein
MSKTVPQPNEISVAQYADPVWGEPIDEILVEPVEFNKPGYVKYREGAAHYNVRDFPNHKLLKEEYSGRYGINLRYWANGYQNQDQHNYEINYSAESNSHPIFTRRYKIRRDEHIPGVKGSNFTGIYLIQVTNAGSGYNPQIPPTVTISGGGGGGATAVALVTNDGKISWVYLTNEGSGYTSTPTVSFSSGAAAATAKINIATKVVGSITVNAGGSNYTSTPTVTIGGTGGSGATAVAQVGTDNKVKTITMTAFGSGYVTANVTITGGGGTGATATANLETVTPALVKEDVSEFPEGDARRSLYLLVTRTFEALPGPVLVQHEYEPFIDDWVRVEKRLVLASTVPGDMYYTARTAGQITEYQPLSKYRSIQIVSKINTAIAWEISGSAADEVYYGTANYNFPNEIHENPSVNVYFAFADDNLAIDFGWDVKVLEGYSGPCRAKFTTRYTFNPQNAAFQAALPTVTLIEPRSDVINDGFVYSGGNLIARATQFIVPSTLHGTLEIDVTGTAPPVTNLPGPIATIPATNPTSIPAGTEIVVSVRPVRWRFGLWVYNFVSVFHP